jgi:hypothetical protein
MEFGKVKIAVSTTLIYSIILLETLMLFLPAREWYIKLTLA